VTRLSPLFLLVLLAGCGPLLKSDEPAASVYGLALAPGAPLAPRIPAVLALAPASAAPGFASERVPLTLPDGRFETYAAMRFVARVPELVDSALLESLRARGGFQAVEPDAGDAFARYRVLPEVREFAAVYASPGHAPTVRVTLYASLVRTRSHELIGTYTASGEAAAAEDHQHAVIAAFDAALAIAIARLGDAVHGACAQAEAPPGH
jgi:ABC-type uncharacterized transport system auxiliary subunit